MIMMVIIIMTMMVIIMRTAPYGCVDDSGDEDDDYDWLQLQILNYGSDFVCPLNGLIDNDAKGTTTKRIFKDFRFLLKKHTS